jgi:2-polyprenyl-3-methyl-5-hydroxy-6-metoxy-1,4-benzoquinol methylase
LRVSNEVGPQNSRSIELVSGDNLRFMSDVKRHYAELLGSVYTWYTSLAGDPAVRAASWLERYGLTPFETYLDLGAGSGAHARALLGAGKRVTAVDFDARLLGELRASTLEHAARLTLEEADLIAHLRGAEQRRFDVVLCAGDTLTHLPAESAVVELVERSARLLTAGGRLALSYRDSTRFAAESVRRFIEVARDRQRTMHCLLEPIDAGHLRVTDIVTEVEADGPRTRLSDYVKLRIPPERILEAADAAGLELVQRGDENGLTTLCFRAHSAAE